MSPPLDEGQFDEETPRSGVAMTKLVTSAAALSCVSSNAICVLVPSCISSIQADSAREINSIGMIPVPGALLLRERGGLYAYLGSPIEIG